MLIERIMKIKIKKLHKDAIIPSYAKDGDAGMDLTAISENGSAKHGYVEFGTGLSIEIPKGYVGLIFPRSSISKKSTILANSVGVIDSGYRGEITLRFKVDTAALFALDSSKAMKNYIYEPYRKGDKVGQLIIMPYPHIEFEEVEELSETERGEGGFGSTDRKS